MSHNDSVGLVSPTTNKLGENVFSPVTVRQSPVSRINQRGNLTGNPRKLRDSAADLYNQIQEWNSRNITGSDILLKINMLKSTSMKEDGNIESDNRYPEGLQELCNDLGQICCLMSEVVRRMVTTKTEVGGVIKLETLKDTNNTPMFLTWPAQRFGDTWVLITNAYERELALKTYIKENVAHVTTEPTLMFHIASWAHQPYIDSRVDIALETLLKETGHR